MMNDDAMDTNRFEQRYRKSKSLDAYYEGNKFCKDSNFIEAIVCYNKAIEINPDNTKAYINRGVVKCKLEKYKEAIVDFNKVIELDPYNAKALYNLNIAKYKLLELDNNNYFVYLNKGTFKFNTGDCSGAIADYKKALEIRPNDWLVKNRLEEAYKKCYE